MAADARVRDAGLPPHVQDVLFGDELGAPAHLALGAAGQILARSLSEPGIGALGVEQLDDRIEGFGRGHGVAALGALEHGNRHAPAALARDAPVGTVGHHGTDAVLGPSGNPLHFRVDGAQGVLAQGVLVHGDEPLVRGAEDDRLVAAPAVRVGVVDLLLGHQRPLLAQPVDDDRVGLVGGKAGELARLAGEHAVVVHGHEHGDVELQRHEVVVLAVAGGRVHGAGAGVQGDVVAVDDRAFDVAADGRGVGEAEQLLARQRHRLAVGAAHKIIVLPAGHLGHGFHQLLGHDEVVTAHRDHDVVGVRRQRHRRVRRQRPGGGRPNEQVGVALGSGGLEHAGHGVQLELHVDGRRHLVGVLDLRFGERRMAVGAPVDGLAAAVDRAFQVQILEDLHVAGLVVRNEREVGVFPVGVHAEALETVALDVDVLLGPLAAALAQLHLGDLGHLLWPERHLNHVLDGLAMAVPSGDVGSEVPALGMAFDDEVLQDLVEGVTDVDGAVGVGRPVVQHEGLAVGVLLQHAAVDVHLLPCGEPLRLAGRQVPAHGEIGLGQVHGVLVAV